MPIEQPPGLIRGKGVFKPHSFRDVAVALNNMQRDINEIFGESASRAAQFQDQVIKEELQTQLGRVIYRNREQDEAIDTEVLRAQTAEDDLLTQCGLGVTRDDLQDTMFSAPSQYGTVAAGTDTEKMVFVAPNACRPSQLTLVNAAALAIDGTDNTKLELINKGADGTGTTVLATFDNATEAFAAFDAVVKTISVPVDLAAGDVLTMKKTDTGTGAAITELFVAIGYAPIP